MGYSLTARFASVQIKDKVLAFMGANFRTWEELVGIDPTFCVRGPTDDVSYGPGDTPVIGFDYSGGEEEVQYCWRVCAWMAIVGSSFPNKCDGCSLRVDCLTAESCKLRVVNYDGCDDCPISEFKGVDEMGFWPLHKRALLIELLPGGGVSRKNFDRIVKAELERLTELWQIQS